jgi:hypothetical protein
MWTVALRMLCTCLRLARSRTLPQLGVWVASGLLAYSPQVGVRAAFPYYVLGCVFSMVRCNGVRYLLGCATGRLWWFLLTTYPETMPPRIPVFSQNDGNFMGRANSNPILDSRVYEATFPEGRINEHVTNLIIETYSSKSTVKVTVLLTLFKIWIIVATTQLLQ